MRREVKVLMQKNDERPESQNSARSKRSINSAKSSAKGITRKQYRKKLVGKKESDMSMASARWAASEYRRKMEAEKRKLKPPAPEEVPAQEQVTSSFVSNFIRKRTLKRPKQFEEDEPVVVSHGACLLLFDEVKFAAPPVKRGFEEFHKAIEDEKRRLEEE